MSLSSWNEVVKVFIFLHYDFFCILLIGYKMAATPMVRFE